MTRRVGEGQIDDEGSAALIVEGIEGTGMGPQAVRGEDLEAIVQYVKTLSPRWREASQRVQ